ncbi:MAG: ATP-binding cassette domain-containing protein [Pirellulales bacterium]|nr:ATP-binding cassette domain-containing protein [Pirellulales bacterium]
MIEINQLQVVRNGNTICEVEDLSVTAGEHLAVVGTNGSGKTTLLRVLAGLITDYKGRCQVNVDERQRTYVHQQPLLFRGTVLGNVRYGMPSRTGGASAALEWLNRLDVGALAHRSTKNLSGAEIRRVALARALACQPRLLILDEPLAELDKQAANTVCQVLNDLSNTTILVASPVEPPPELDCQTHKITPPLTPSP